MKKESDYLKYFIHSMDDTRWGIVCTTAGYQDIPPHSPYPLSSTHPMGYNFNKNGRVLDEFQAVYITRGKGTFHSDSVHEAKVTAGDVIILFPGERHIYYPDSDVGWMEMWVGFKGDIIMNYATSFFSKESPVISIGIKEEIIQIYNKIMGLSMAEKIGMQQAMGGEILALLGEVFYEKSNYTHRNNKNIDKIERAKFLLKSKLDTQISPAEVAEEIGVSYSLLRSQFKSITGISMSTYLIQQRLILAKKLLTSSNKSIQEIAFETGFESMSRFCCSFRQHVGMTAGQFRERNSMKK